MIKIIFGGFKDYFLTKQINKGYLEVMSSRFEHSI